MGVAISLKGPMRREHLPSSALQAKLLKCVHRIPNEISEAAFGSSIKVVFDSLSHIFIGGLKGSNDYVLFSLFSQVFDSTVQ